MYVRTNESMYVNVCCSVNMTGCGGDGVGYLFFSNAACVRVEDGTTVELGGKRWKAQHAVDGLVLSSVDSTDDKEQQAVEARLNIGNEVKHRKLEAESLGVQHMQLAAACEQVC